RGTFCVRQRLLWTAPGKNSYNEVRRRFEPDAVLRSFCGVSRMNITMIGTGYVGLVTGTCLAESGNDVTCVDIDQAKIDALRGGTIPIYEPGLSELVQFNLKSGRLRFTTSAAEAVPAAECVFIAVGTPQSDDGSANL